MKKFLPYLFLAAGIVTLFFLLSTLHHREELGMRLTHPKIILQGVSFVLLMSVAFTILLKKF